MKSHNTASSGTLCVGAQGDFVVNAGSRFQVLDEEQLLVTRVIAVGVVRIDRESRL